MDRFVAQAWAGILKGLTIREDIAINEGGEIAWAIRKDSPKLSTELAEFVAVHKIGTAFGNDLRLRYVKTSKSLKNALAKPEAEKLKTRCCAFPRIWKALLHRSLSPCRAGLSGVRCQPATAQ